MCTRRLFFRLTNLTGHGLGLCSRTNKLILYHPGFMRQWTMLLKQVSGYIDQATYVNSKNHYVYGASTTC